MEQLGIDAKLLAAQVINFLIIVLALQKLLYRPILTMLEKRKKEIGEGLALTEKMRQEEEKLAAKREKVLAAARHEGQLVIEQAKKDAKDVERESVVQAQKQGEEIIGRARAEAERIREQTAMDLRKEAVTVAASMVRKLIGSVLTTTDQHRLVSQHIKKLEALAKRGKLRSSL